MGKVQKPERKLTPLEENQMKEIDRLQEEIKLFDFDRTKDRQKIRELQLTLRRKKNTIKNVIQELELMRKENNYSRMLVMINALKVAVKEGYDE